jgi:hypothetical protein
MEKLKFLVFAVMFMQVDLAFGQNANLTNLEQQIETFRLALIDPTVENLDALVMESLTYGHSSGKVENKNTFIENLVNGNSNFEEVTFFDQKIIIEKKTAVVRHTLSATTHDKGKTPGEVNLHILTVWVKSGKTWKLMARQAVKQQ